MEEKFQKLLEYNFENCVEWRQYYFGLEPSPAKDKLAFFKKKFYYLKIDTEFDYRQTYPGEDRLNQSTGVPNSKPSWSGNTTNTTSTNRPNRNAPVPFNRHQIFSHIEFVLWLVVLLCLPFQRWTLRIAVFGFILRPFRRLGVPKFNMEYAQELFKDDHFQLLPYTLLIMLERYLYFPLFPILLTILLNICLYLKNQPLGFIARLAQKVADKRVRIYEVRANTELLLGFMYIIGFFIGVNSFVLPIFFWQFMRYAYNVNTDIQTAFRKLNYQVERIKWSPRCPQLLKKGLEKCQTFVEYMTKTETDPRAAAAMPNCNIF
jgi:hypothetical protein